MADKIFTNEEKEDEELIIEKIVNPLNLLNQGAGGYFFHRGITSGSFVRSVYPGENIQKAIDEVYQAGGGTVLLQNGEHICNYNINLYSNIYLQGQTIDGCIINFNGGNFSIKAIGTNAYNTGTITINTGSTTVTGAGTAWTTDMIGRYIMIKGFWYLIFNVNAVAQTITISATYGDENIVGYSYTIANIIQDVILRTFTVRNSISSAIKFQYVNWLKIEDIKAQESLIGIDINTLSAFTINDTYGLYNYTNFSFINCHYGILATAGSVVTLLNNGMDFNTCSDIEINAFYIIGSTADGINITSCNDMVFLATTVKISGGQGIELVSGNNMIEFVSCAMKNNTSDGLKLTATSDNCIITNCLFDTNGGYGVNVAAATCDNNFIKQNNYISNVSGELNDAGTGTKTDIVSKIRVYQNAINQVIKNAAYTKVMFDAENYDDLLEFDNTVKIGTASATSANHLVDATLSQFTAADVGREVWNTTDNTYATITAFNSTSDVTIDADIMADTEGYQVFASRFTAKYTGHYIIHACIQWSEAITAGYCYLNIKKNNNQRNNTGTISQALYDYTPTGYLVMQSTDLIQLDAGDYIQVYIVNAAGANKELESTEANTYLNIYKLS